MKSKKSDASKPPQVHVPPSVTEANVPVYEQVYWEHFRRDEGSNRTPGRCPCSLCIRTREERQRKLAKSHP